jgi:hypothetical protein
MYSGTSASLISNVATSKIIVHHAIAPFAQQSALRSSSEHNAKTGILSVHDIAMLWYRNTNYRMAGGTICATMPLRTQNIPNMTEQASGDIFFAFCSLHRLHLLGGLAKLICGTFY